MLNEVLSEDTGGLNNPSRSTIAILQNPTASTHPAFAGQVYKLRRGNRMGVVKSSR
jgi:hypothetical protein